MHLPAIYHFSTRTHFGSQRLLCRATALRLWDTIPIHFPKIYALLIMPDHIHLAAEAPKKGITLQLLLKNHIKTRDLEWSESPALVPLSNATQLLRVVKYIHLNPCRAGLAKDPLDWEFSTHRDYLDLTAKKIVAQKKILNLVKIQSARDFHQHVSSDFTVQPRGTPYPIIPLHDAHLFGAPPKILESLAAYHRCSAKDKGLIPDAAYFLYRGEDWSAKKTGAVLNRTASHIRRIVNELAAPLTPPEIIKTYLSDSRLQQEHFK